MNKTLSILIILLALFSCENDVTNSKKVTISGNITSGLFGGGIDSVMVMLIDANTDIDTLNYENKSAFLDTVYSDSAGVFVFENIEKGDYYVFPFRKGYHYKGINTSIDSALTVSGKDDIYLEFEASPAFMSNSYVFAIHLINVPDSIDVSDHVSIERQFWYLFIPVWERWGMAEVIKEPSKYYLYCEVEYGFLGFASMSNTFRINYHGGPEETIFASYVISTPITNTPHYIEYEIDYETGNVSRKQ